MARPKTPSKVMELRGSYKNHPENRNKHEPKPEGPLGPPDAGLTPSQRNAWNTIANAAPLGVLTSADCFVIHTAAVLWAEFLDDPQAMPTNRMGLMLRLLGSFGLSPSDRAGMRVTTTESNAFDDV